MALRRGGGDTAGPEAADPPRARPGADGGSAGAYLALTAVGFFLRGADWKWRPREPRSVEASADHRLYWPGPRVARAEIPVVLERRGAHLTVESLWWDDLEHGR